MSSLPRAHRLLLPVQYKAVFNGQAVTATDRYFRLLAIARDADTCSVYGRVDSSADGSAGPGLCEHGEVTTGTESPRPEPVVPGVSNWQHSRLGHSRLGLAIAKKNIRKASQRNRIKRQIKEAFRASLIVPDALLDQQALTNFDDKAKNSASPAAAPEPGLDIVVLAKPPAALTANKLLREALDRLLQQVIRAAHAHGK
jgi:RNase P protein component